MVFEKETKERFVQMLKERQIIVIRCGALRRTTYGFKFIGANNDGKWDFTPLLASYSNFPTNHAERIREKVIFGIDESEIVVKVLQGFVKEGLIEKWADCDDEFAWYEKVRHLLCTFYI